MTSEKQHIMTALGGVLAVVVIAWTLVISFGILDDPPGRIRTEDVERPANIPAQGVEITIDESTELDDDPDRFIGKTVQVLGSIKESASPDVRIFILDIDGAIGDDEILVIRNASAWKARLDGGTVIQAVGEVRRMNPDLLRKLNNDLALDLNLEEISGFDQKLVMIADDISIPAH